MSPPIRLIKKIKIEKEETPKKLSLFLPSEEDPGSGPSADTESVSTYIWGLSASRATKENKYLLLQPPRPGSFLTVAQAD